MLRLLRCTLPVLLAVSLGFADYGVADRAATALVYRGVAGVGELGYVGGSRHLHWGLGIGFAGGSYYAAHHPDRSVTFGTVGQDGTTDEVVVPMRGRVLVPRAGLEFAGRWTGRRVSVLAGGRLDYELFYPQGFVPAGLTQSLVHSPLLRVRVDATPRHRVEFGGAAPLVGWIVRMPYHQSVSAPNKGTVAGLVELGASIQGPRTLQGVELDGRYRFRVHPKVGLTAAAAVHYVHNATPRTLQRLDQRYTLGVEFYL